MIMVPGVAVRFWGAQGVTTVKMEVGIVLSRITIMITAASRLAKQEIATAIMNITNMDRIREWEM